MGRLQELERLGVTGVILHLQWAGMPAAATLRSLEILAEDVLPRMSGRG